MVLKTRAARNAKPTATKTEHSGNLTTPTTRRRTPPAAPALASSNRCSRTRARLPLFALATDNVLNN